ncbi:MAG TPA: META domain-containing protein [Anaerolineales bacterium]|nr:META domain-containing protein [Anaerolineales bacterium]
MKKLLFAVFVIGLILAACTTQPKTPVTGTWLVVSYGQESNQIPALPDLNRSVIFDGDGTINGNVGCNSFKGTYTIDGAKIIFQSIEAMKLNCPPDVIMEQEQAILQILSGSADFRIEGRHLTITNSDQMLVMEFDH